jgi:hypothetical protein
LEDYAVELSDVMGECRLLVAISGVLFGFLLNVSILTKGKGETDITMLEVVLLILALAFAAVSVLSFLLPTIYHHSRSFPVTLEEKKKIYIRSHRFIIAGLTSLVLTMYFSLALAFQHLISFYSIVAAAIILLIPALLFRFRK